MRIKYIMMVFISVLVIIIVLTIIITQHPKFGRLPRGERLERIKKSPNFRDGIFRNLHHTPQLATDAGFSKMFRDYISAKNKRPPGKIPSVKTNLLNLSPDEDVLVWFGHSSYFIQVDDKKILVDPVFSGHASPFSFSIKAFEGTDIYTAEDIPELDYLIITHDHWDHLDYKTILKLKPKVKQVITGLGVGEHLEYWKFDKDRIIEKDWNEEIPLEDGFKMYSAPARHFSGRKFKHKKTIWSSFILLTPTMKIYIGGDSGYDTHFADIGNKFGPFDLAILENGQYNTSWKFIHAMPEEVVQAAKDLGAKRFFPVHNSKFALANHPWDDPLIKVTEYNRDSNIPLVTPMIGQKVRLKDYSQKFERWWEKLK